MATQVPYVAVPPGIASRVSSVFGRTGNVVAQAGDYSAALIAGGLSRVATTGPNGFALQDATPTILSWTAQNDGNLHIAILAVVIKVSSAETGGAISIDESGAIAANTQLTAGSLGPGTWFFFGNSAYTPVPVAPGGAFALVQSSALTAGAATVYAEIWAS